MEPIELYCEECGYKIALNTTERYPREVHIAIWKSALTTKREDGRPYFYCMRCDSDGKTVEMKLHE